MSGRDNLLSPPAMRGRKMTAPRTVAAGYVATLIEAVTAAGNITAAELLVRAGLPADLGTADRRLAHDAVSALWQAGLAASGDADLGLHVGERVRPGSFSALGHLLMSCTTLREAAAETERFAGLVGGGGRFDSRPEGRGSWLIYRPLDPDWPCRRHRVEAVLTAALTFAGWLTGRAVRPAAARLRHARPAATAEHVRVFGCLPRFDADEDALLLPDDVLDLGIAQASPALKGVLADYARNALDDLDRGDLRGRVSAGIRAALTDARLPGIDEVAAGLNLSPRTLQRRLKDQGSGFAAEVNAVREAMARDLLRAGDRPIADIAWRLGFADTANFHRAFKAWTGMTPAAWRRAAPQAPPAR